jgi:hypothetical protein
LRRRIAGAKPGDTMRKFVSAFVAAGTGIIVLGCSADSPTPLCMASTTGEVSSQIVTDGANQLTLSLSSTASEVRLLVDGVLAFDVTATSSAQGWATTEIRLFLERRGVTQHDVGAAAA